MPKIIIGDVEREATLTEISEIQRTQARAEPTEEERRAQVDAELAGIDDKLRAIVRWAADKHGLTMQEAVAELRPIYRQIRGV